MDSMRNVQIAASEQAALAVDEEKLKAKGLHNVDEGEACSICLNAPLTSATRAVASPCLHAAFDFTCLVTWLDEQDICPLCKQQVDFVKHDFDPHGTGFKKYEVIAKRMVNTDRRSAIHSRLHVVPRRHNPRPRRPQETHGLTRPKDVILRRRYIYKHKLRSLHCGTNRISRFVNFTPKTVRTDKELESRARAWIRRELEVFEWTVENREWLLEYFIALLKSVDLRAADGNAEKMVGELIGRDFAAVFIHELYAFLRSPFARVADYDNWAQYEMTVPTYSDGRPLDARVIATGPLEIAGESSISTSNDRTGRHGV